MIDKWGFKRSQQYLGSDRTGKYYFIRQTTNPNISIWVEPEETDNGKIVYVVSKSTRNPEIQLCKNGDFTTKIITQFSKATDAKEWINKEYAHMFG